MFWQLDDETIPGRPADLFELTEQVRCKDEWLMAVLNANRQGAETWEMYCFTHGLPTLHVGSWMPQEDQPRCSDARCTYNRRGGKRCGRGRLSGQSVSVWNATHARLSEGVAAECS